MMVVALFLFFSNARYSEEFTGWVKISVAGTLDEATVTKDIAQYMEIKWYKDSNVVVVVEKDITKISLKTQVQKDEQVNILSKDISVITTGILMFDFLSMSGLTSPK